MGGQKPEWMRGQKEELAAPSCLSGPSRLQPQQARGRQSPGEGPCCHFCLHVPCPGCEQPLTSGLSASGHPQPIITWFKDGRPLGGGDAHHTSPDGAHLWVPQANLSHAGHYSCIASNVVGEKTKHFQLSVLGEPGMPAWAGGVTAP